MLENNNRGLWLDEELRAIDNISYMESSLLSKIQQLDNDEKHCWASNKYFAYYFKTSERTISRAINHLEELGYISTKMCVCKSGTERQITFTYDGVSTKCLEGCSQNGERGIDKLSTNKYIYNNIENNKEYIKSISSDERNSHIPDSLRKGAFDYEILDKQIDKCFRGRNETNMEIIKNAKIIIHYYYNMYEKYKGKSHPILNNEAMSGVLDSLVMGSHMTDEAIWNIETYLAMIDEHFETDYREYTDFNICHFMGEEIRDILFYQTCY